MTWPVERVDPNTLERIEVNAFHLSATMLSPLDPTRVSPVSRWDAVSRERIADCRVFHVERAWFRHPARAVTHDFFVLDSPDWVNVVAVTTTGELVLVKQFRFGVQEFCWEIPGGLLDSTEDPIAAGRRELLEETGFGGGEARVLGSVWPNPAVQNNRCHFVLVEGVSRTAELAWDEHEEIESIQLPVEEILTRARAGEIVHPLTLTALFLFEPHWRKPAKPPVV
jgi:ADP-ribose pyrophosphatase